jgi:hypothetical protein
MLTKHLEECLSKLKKRFKQGEEFTTDDITYGMFTRARYNLDRLVTLGYLKTRYSDFDGNSWNIDCYYRLVK